MYNSTKTNIKWGTNWKLSLIERVTLAISNILICSHKLKAFVMKWPQRFNFICSISATLCMLNIKHYLDWHVFFLYSENFDINVQQAINYAALFCMNTNNKKNEIFRILVILLIQYSSGLFVDLIIRKKMKNDIIIAVTTIKYVESLWSSEQIKLIPFHFPLDIIKTHSFFFVVNLQILINKLPDYINWKIDTIKRGNKLNILDSKIQ